MATPDSVDRSARSKAVRRALEALERDGRLTADEVVQAAADPMSPLHEFFDWDDQTAAHSWRLDQARRLIRSVKVVEIIQTREVRSVCYLRDPIQAPRDPGYVSLEILKQDPGAMRAALAHELARVESGMRRAELITQSLSTSVDLRRELRQLRQALAILREEVTSESEITA